MKLKAYWLLATAVYFYAAFYVLWSYAPPDPGDGYGSGYTADLYLPGLKPSFASWQEYMNNACVRFQFRLPYFVVAFVFTVMGAVVPNALLRRSAKLAKHPIVSSMTIGFVLLLIGPALLDGTAKLRLWEGPIWFSWDWMVRIMVLVFLPLTLLSGLVTAGATRPRTRQNTVASSN